MLTNAKFDLHLVKNNRSYIPNKARLTAIVMDYHLQAVQIKLCLWIGKRNGSIHVFFKLLLVFLVVYVQRILNILSIQNHFENFQK